MTGTDAAAMHAEANATWTTFRELIESLPAERWQERVGKGSWRVVDIVAHLAYWGDRLPDDLRACLDDTAVKELGSEINKRVAKERRGWSREQATSALAVAEEHALPAIAALPDTHPRLKRALKLAHHEAVEHVQTHERQIREWLSERAG